MKIVLTESHDLVQSRSPLVTIAFVIVDILLDKKIMESTILLTDDLD